MLGGFTTTHQGWPEAFRQKGIAQRGRVTHHHNAVAIQAVMTVPHPQLPPLAHACRCIEAQIGQELTEYRIGIGILFADEAAHTDVHAPGDRKGPGKTLFHQAEFKAGGAIGQVALPVEPHRHRRCHLHFLWAEAKLLRPWGA